MHQPSHVHLKTGAAATFCILLSSRHIRADGCCAHIAAVTSLVAGPSSGGLYFFLAVAGAACFLLSLLTCCCFCCQRRPGAAPKMSRKEKRKQQVGSTQTLPKSMALAFYRLSGHHPPVFLSLMLGRQAGGVHFVTAHAAVEVVQARRQAGCVAPHLSLVAHWLAVRILASTDCTLSLRHLFLLCRSSLCPLLLPMHPPRLQRPQAATQCPTPTSMQPIALTQTPTSSPAWHMCKAHLT